MNAVTGMDSGTLVRALLDLYNTGAPYTVGQLATVYSDTVTFTDPAHTVHGLAALCDSLNRQYAAVEACEFVDGGHWHSGDQIFLRWDMQLRHRHLNSGRPITVNGLSQLQCTGTGAALRIQVHRDYFDLGQLLYEHVPLLGYLNRQLKQRLSP